MLKKKLNLVALSFLLYTSLESMENEPKTPERQNIKNDDHYSPTKDPHLHCLFQFILINDPESFQFFLKKEPKNLYKKITAGRYKDQSPYSYILTHGLEIFLNILYETKKIILPEIEEILRDDKKRKNLRKNFYKFIDSEDAVEFLNPNTKKWMESIVTMKNNNNHNVIENNLMIDHNKNYVKSNASNIIKIIEPVKTHTETISPSILLQYIKLNDLISFESMITKDPQTLFTKNSNPKYSQKTPYHYILKHGLIDFLEVLYKTKIISTKTIKKTLKNKITKKLNPNIKNWLIKKLQEEGKKNLETIIHNKFYLHQDIKKIQENTKKIIKNAKNSIKAEAICNHLEQKNKQLPVGKSFIMTPFLGLVSEDNFKKITE